MRLTEKELQDGLNEFEHWHGIAEYMHRTGWTLEDHSIGGPDNHPRFFPNAEYLRGYVERGCRTYMMNDIDWVSAWHGLGFIVYVATDNRGNQWLTIDWKGNPVERGKDLGVM